MPLLAALGRHGVRYIAVGSFAAIAQGVDLPMTDLDIVPAMDEDNRLRLVEALRELEARETAGDRAEPIDELVDDPMSLTDTRFREFTTRYGKLDLVFRPAGFTRGYEDLVDRVVVLRLEEEVSPGESVLAFIADKSAVYESKRAAGRQKDAEVLTKFGELHQPETRQAVRARYRADQARRAAGSRHETGSAEGPEERAES